MTDDMRSAERTSVELMPIVAHESEVSALLRIIKWLIIAWVVTIVLFVSLLVPQNPSESTGGEADAPVATESAGNGAGGQDA